jgi:integrase
MADTFIRRNKLRNKRVGEMRSSGPARPHKVGGIWYLVRRVPKAFAHLDRRVIVRVSTEIPVVDDPRGMRARPLVAQLARDLDNYWSGLGDGEGATALIRFEAAQKRARQLGVVYQTARELAEGDLGELLRRIKILMDRDALDDESTVAAVMGGEARPVLMLSGIVDAFAALKEFANDGMSAKQLYRWRLPLDKAVRNFIRILGGDREASKVTLADALVFRNYLRDRIRDDEIKVPTANKQIGHLNQMLRTVEREQHLGIRPVFAELRIEGGVDGQRPAFSKEWIETVILKPRALDGLNDEARAIVYLVCANGFRPAEAANLLPQRIVLDHDVPHVQIRGDLRRLKTHWSLRDAPLVGLGLWIMRQHPNGFPRYRDNEDTLSATVNKYLFEHGMLPTEDHTLYSFRHGFEDRMIALEFLERSKSELMGHKYDRARYGDPSLEIKQRWLRQVWFMPPGHYGPP